MLWADDAKTQPIDLAGATVKAEIRDKAMGKLIATFDCTDHAAEHHRRSGLPPRSRAR